jgi:hypothetical protein
MSRYNTTKQIKDENGTRRASTTIFPSMPSRAEDIFVKITSPERLDLLAYRFYGDASKWWIIASSNGLGKGTLFVPENTIIRIPADSKIQETVEQTNNNR